jgi:Skp family chaperone for outer membrane proteins
MLVVSSFFVLGQKTQKIASVHYDSVLQKLPIYLQGLDSLTELQKKLEQEMNKKHNELALFYSSIASWHGGMDTLTRTNLEKKLQKLQMEINDFMVFAQKQLEQKKVVLLQICHQKILQTVRFIALLEGYDFIFYSQKDNKSILFYKKYGEITNLVIVVSKIMVDNKR